jgi:REP element-mobilizing transposase RayT
MSEQLDTNVFPLAYLITFRTYGTWLHGDARGSMDREHNAYGTPRLSPNENRRHAEALQLRSALIILNMPQRKAVESAVREVCRWRGYRLLALNARTNHVHSVISAGCKPEPILDALKAYATRKLRRMGLIGATITPWVRHGSTRYLWKERHVEKAMDYVLYGQGTIRPSLTRQRRPLGGPSRSPTVREGSVRSETTQRPFPSRQQLPGEPSLTVGLLLGARRLLLGDWR